MKSRNFLGLIVSIWVCLFGMGSVSTPTWANDNGLTSQWPDFEKPRELSQDDPVEVRDETSPPIPREEKKATRVSAPEKAAPVKNTQTKSETETMPSDPPMENPEVFEWVKKVGDSISLRATKERLYIHAGPTRIVLDQQGDLTILSGKSLTIESKKNIFLKAGEDIQLKAGGKVVQQVGSP